MRTIVRIFILLVVLGGIGGGVWWYMHRNDKAPVSYRTEAVKRGELLATISATGTIEPEEAVDVGAQVAGKIDKLGDDPHKPGKFVDYISEVEQGQLLAHIDDSGFQKDLIQTQAQVKQAEAQVKQATSQIAQAVANVTRSQADLVQLNAKLDQATRDWDRAQNLAKGGGDALSQTDYDMYRANFEIARANVAVGQAAIKQAEAAKDQADAAKEQAEAAVKAAEAGVARVNQNIAYCTITSPVKGVIIDRRVNTGQTVVASLNAPSLFLIAKDLRKMQVWVPVNEADIGSIRAGQPVTFTTDANPGRTFKGEVGKVRLNANMSQNVVTYTVEVMTDNSDMKLLPYSTASVQFEVARHTDVLLVPNAALRWTPKAEQIAPGAQTADKGAGGRRGAGKGPTSSSTRPTTDESRPTPGQLWVQDGGYVKPINVRVIATDGMMSEVAGKDVKDGMDIVTGENTQADSGDTAKNPFMPQMRRPGGR